MKGLVNFLVAFGALLVGGPFVGCSPTLPPPPRPAASAYTADLGRPPRAGDFILLERCGCRLLWIEGGEFEMGSIAGRPDEQPVSRQRVRGFWLGSHEVTNQQFGGFWKSRASGEPYPASGERADNSLPVTGITFEEARDFAAYVGGRLPSELEWEYAARAGFGLEYPTASGRLSHALANYWGRADRDRWLESPAPPGSFPPNPWGIFDLAGNAWEWTSSLYRPYPYRAVDGREDLRSHEMGVLRGGSWQYDGSYLRSSRRYPFRRHLRLDYAGLRLARSGPEVDF